MRTVGALCAPAALGAVTACAVLPVSSVAGVEIPPWKLLQSLRAG